MTNIDRAFWFLLGIDSVFVAAGLIFVGMAVLFACRGGASVDALVSQCAMYGTGAVCTAAAIGLVALLIR